MRPGTEANVPFIVPGFCIEMLLTTVGPLLSSNGKCATKPTGPAVSICSLLKDISHFVMSASISIERFFKRFVNSSLLASSFDFSANWACDGTFNNGSAIRPWL